MKKKLIDSILNKWGYAFCLSLFFMFTSAYSIEESPKKIVVLTSVNNDQWVLPWRKATNIIKKKFQKEFKHLPYELIIISNATQVDLHYYLTSPETEALFWIGHSAAEERVSAMVGLKERALVLDSHRRNVGPIFQKISSQIKIISIVGCSSAELLEENKRKGYYDHNSEVSLFGFERPISLAKGVDAAIKNAIPILQDSNSKKEDFKIDHGSLEITKILFVREKDDKINDSFQVSINGHFVEVIPPNIPGRPQEIIIDIPSQWIVPSKVNKIMISSGFNLISKREKNNGIFDLRLLDSHGELGRFIQKGIDVNSVNDHLFYYRN